MNPATTAIATKTKPRPIASMSFEYAHSPIINIPKKASAGINFCQSLLVYSESGFGSSFIIVCELRRFIFFNNASIKWEVRENVRHAFTNKPRKFSTIKDALADIKTRLHIPMDEYLKKSAILRQRRLTDF